MRGLLLALALLLVPWVALAQASSFGDGVHVVGTDIAPGTYRAPGGDTCSWARLSGFDGTDDDIIASEDVTGPAVVTIEAGDAGLEVTGCGRWTALVAPEPSFDASAAEAAVFRELRATDTTLDIGIRSFVNRWNEAVEGYGRAYRIDRRPTVRLDDDVLMRYIEVPADIEVPEGRSSTSVGLRGYLQPDDRVRTAGLVWLPQEANAPDVHGDRSNALILMNAFVAAVNPRLEEDHDLMAGFGWPQTDEAFDAFQGFGTSVVQQSSAGVVYTLTAFRNEEGRDVVWLTARRDDAAADP